MPILTFPAGQAVGTLEWLGSKTAAAPVLAMGDVTIPDGTEITLDVMVIESVRRTEYVAEDSESWEITGASEPADLSFVRSLPADSITNLQLRAPIVAASVDALSHLAPGLRRLHLAWTDLTDEALATIGTLHGLSYLQSWGNRFTDRGVQQLASLTRLESLYLEEETLSAAAFDFATGLPHLTRLGLQDVRISAAELAELRRRLPGVEVH